MSVKNEMVTVLEASEQSGLSPSFIRHIALNKRIRSERVGRRLYLVNLNDILTEAYIKDPRRRNYRRGNK